MSDQKDVDNTFKWIVSNIRMKLESILNIDKNTEWIVLYHVSFPEFRFLCYSEWITLKTEWYTLDRLCDLIAKNDSEWMFERFKNFEHDARFSIGMNRNFHLVKKERAHGKLDAMQIFYPDLESEQRSE